jgi:holo-[acyl-carrier protein] synthase
MRQIGRQNQSASQFLYLVRAFLGQSNASPTFQERHDSGAPTGRACIRIDRSSPAPENRSIMEILGIGTDIVECLRIGKMIQQHGELFLRRVYTPREIRYCQSRKHAIEHFAGRWAAKEAILKAMGTGWSKGIAWTDIEVRSGQGERPEVMVGGVAKEITRERAIGEILVSISHCRTYATAYAMALARKAAKPAPPDAQ